MWPNYWQISTKMLFDFDQHLVGHASFSPICRLFSRILFSAYPHDLFPNVCLGITFKINMIGRVRNAACCDGIWNSGLEKPYHQPHSSHYCLHDYSRRERSKWKGDFFFLKEMPLLPWHIWPDDLRGFVSYRFDRFWLFLLTELLLGLIFGSSTLRTDFYFSLRGAC